MELAYISLHEWLIFMVNVDQYTNPMDPMGYNFATLNSQNQSFKRAASSWGDLSVPNPMQSEKAALRPLVGFGKDVPKTL